MRLQVALGKLEGLRGFTTTTRKIRASGLAHVAAETLDLCRCSDIKDGCVQELLVSLSSLQRLNLHECTRSDITDGGLADFGPGFDCVVERSERLPSEWAFSQCREFFFGGAASRIYALMDGDTWTILARESTSSESPSINKI